MTRYLRVGVLVLALLAGCGSDKGSDGGNTATGADANAAGSGKAVAATLKEFSIVLKPAKAAAGEVHFKLANTGAVEHEFVVFKTDLDPTKLPVDADGNVEEEGAEVKHIGEQEGVKPKEPAELSLTLDPGNYVVVCNLPGHYKAGMRAGLVVA